MIEVGIPLLTHERKRLLLHEAVGEQGLVAVGVGPASGRGFQMLHRFERTCGLLDAAGINVVFIYPAESARHVQDPLSIMAARFRRKPSLLLDDAGHFFGRSLPVHQLHAMRFDRYMTCIEAAAISVRDAGWEALLREFLLKVHAEVT